MAVFEGTKVPRSVKKHLTRLSRSDRTSAEIEIEMTLLAYRQKNRNGKHRNGGGKEGLFRRPIPAKA